MLIKALRIIRRLAVRLPRGAVSLMRMIGGDEPAAWSKDGQLSPRVFWDSQIRRLVIVDLREWACRWHYLAGKYHDWPHQLVMHRTLAEGDIYVDIGANRGVHTLLASRLVGPAGRVYSFEPNPQTFDVLKAHLLINHIHNCEAFNLGLAETHGEFPLVSADGTSGTCSFRLGSSQSAHYARVVPGDSRLDVIPRVNRVLIKIDTEGYEFRVLRGLTGFLARPNLLVYAEITPDWLFRIGESAVELYEFMAEFGFTPYLVRQSWTRGITPKLDLLPLGPPPHYQHEILFARGSLSIQNTPHVSY